jgi:hypothetical protein
LVCAIFTKTITEILSKCRKERSILTKANARSIVYRFFYSDPEDPESIELGQLVQVQGIEAAILKVCELDTDNEQEQILYQLILASYHDISKQSVML